MSLEFMLQVHDARSARESVDDGAWAEFSMESR